MSLNLTAAGLADQKAWEAAGYALPSYDREAMITRTKESPCWVHFGAGNIFRSIDDERSCVSRASCSPKDR